MTEDLLGQIDHWGPEKVVCVSDRRTGMRGVLVLDNTARGMGKGGTRMSPTLTVAEVARLARTMTWKWAAVDLFHGGAKAGIRFDPASPDKEAAIRAFARALSNEVPAEYVLGLDMGMGEADAAIVVDELGRGTAVGLPRALGGLPYDQLGVTGFGVAEAVDAACAARGLALGSARVAIQGYGAVGWAAARRLTELGATIVAVSNAEGALHDPDGLDIPRLAALRAEQGDAGIRAYGGILHDPDAVLRVDADILLPCAREDLVDEQVARSTTARLVVEGANLPTTPAAKEVLHARGIPVVPDFIANAGGIVAAAYSMDARLSPFTVDPERVFEMITQKLRANTVTVLGTSDRLGVTPHVAAQRMAESRVAEAMGLRGQPTVERVSVAR
ncbi:Glu/Leu/Phe/Val dehydrogenase [Nocardioides sp. L-11A]|uniref:Glu/Leu/Phe/Val family dehydrogenase n=1 Tax=Nocardioides sp. L-11A TaxID=3043848 RepID=UPI002499F415|nr:Glu/Leu/Phe/Val dehydrogenase dimerization domain-containing protein [Nocardioides sp. L-11A]